MNSKDARGRSEMYMMDGGKVSKKERQE